MSEWSSFDKARKETIDKPFVKTHMKSNFTVLQGDENFNFMKVKTYNI